jgi:hypothetical protein
MLADTRGIIRIAWIVFAILALLATVFLPGILVEKSRQEREGLGFTTPGPAVPSALARPQGAGSLL